MKIYIAVTNDKYELPIMVVDSVQQLSEAFGIKYRDIHSLISKGIPAKKKNVKFYRVEVDDDELLAEQINAKKEYRRLYAMTHADSRYKKAVVFNKLTEETHVFYSYQDAENYMGMCRKYISQRIYILKTNEFRYKHYIVKVGDKD